MPEWKLLHIRGEGGSLQHWDPCGAHFPDEGQKRGKGKEERLKKNKNQ